MIIGSEVISNNRLDMTPAVADALVYVMRYLQSLELSEENIKDGTGSERVGSKVQRRHLVNAY